MMKILPTLMIEKKINMIDPQEECECGEDDCESCIRAFKRWCEDLETQRERRHLEKLWGPNGLLYSPDDPICQES